MNNSNRIKILGFKPCDLKDLPPGIPQIRDSKGSREGEGEGGINSMVVIPQCHFFKPNGARCGSPALRGKRLCYFHARPRPRPPVVVPEVPDPSDPLAILHWTMYGLMKGTLDVKAAGQLIYSVQQMLTH